MAESPERLSATSRFRYLNLAMLVMAAVGIYWVLLVMDTLWHLSGSEGLSLEAIFRGQLSEVFVYSLRRGVPGLAGFPGTYYSERGAVIFVAVVSTGILLTWKILRLSLPRALGVACLAGGGACYAAGMIMLSGDVPAWAAGMWLRCMLCGLLYGLIGFAIAGGASLVPRRQGR